jgi:hypothetical protein
MKLQASGPHNHSGNDIRVHVGRRASILEITIPIGLSGAGNTARATSVGNTVRELIDGSSFMLSCETALVTSTVGCDVFGVLLAKLLQSSFDDRKSTRLAHRFGTEIGVATSTIPVTRDGLRVVGNDDAEFLADSSQQVSRDPHVVTGVDTFGRTNLVFPLPGHNFTVNTRNINAGIHATLVMGFHNGSTESILSAVRAVVRTLRARETTLGPSEGSNAIGFEKSVLLFNTEPRLQGKDLVHGFLASDAGVVIDGCSIGLPAVTQHEDVGLSAERVREDRARLEHDLRVFSGGLARGGTIEVPHRKLIRAGHGGRQGLRFGANVSPTAANPNVFGHNLTILGKLVKLVHDGPVEDSLLGEDRVHVQF